MYEIATCKDPFDGAAPTAVAVMVVRDKARPLIPEDTDLPEEHNELMTHCWEQEPADRPFPRNRLAFASPHALVLEEQRRRR